MVGRATIRSARVHSAVVTRGCMNSKVAFNWVTTPMIRNHIAGYCTLGVGREVPIASLEARAMGLFRLGVG